MIVFIADGAAIGMKSEVTQLLGLSNFQRVSHVEPVNPWLRYFFYSIRKQVSDQSILAGFTRRWPCRWQADIFDGPVLGPFRYRAEAIESEIKFLNSRIEETNESNNIRSNSTSKECRERSEAHERIRRGSPPR